MDLLRIHPVFLCSLGGTLASFSGKIALDMYQSKKTVTIICKSCCYNVDHCENVYIYTYIYFFLYFFCVYFNYLFCFGWMIYELDYADTIKDSWNFMLVTLQLSDVNKFSKILLQFQSCIFVRCSFS